NRSQQSLGFVAEWQQLPPILDPPPLLSLTHPGRALALLAEVLQSTQPTLRRNDLSSQEQHHEQLLLFSPRPRRRQRVPDEFRLVPIVHAESDLGQFQGLWVGGFAVLGRRKFSDDGDNVINKRRLRRSPRLSPGVGGRHSGKIGRGAKMARFRAAG